MFSIKGTLKAISIVASSGLTYDSSAGLVLSITFLAVPGLLGLYFSRMGIKYLKGGSKKDTAIK